MFNLISDLEFDKINVRQMSRLLNFKRKTPNLVVAGDVTYEKSWTILVSFFTLATEKYDRVFFVPGNHEYYSQNPNVTIESVNEELRTLEKMFTGLYVLLDDFHLFKKEGFAIFGGTLWSSLKNRHQHINLPIQSVAYKHVTTNAWNAMHYTSVFLLEQAIQQAEENNLKLYVVTHYAPTYDRTLSPRYEGNLYNNMYCTSLETHFSESIQAWMFGHTGYNADYFVGSDCVSGYSEREKGIRIVSNQVNVKEGKPFSLNQVIF